MESESYDCTQVVTEVARVLDTGDLSALSPAIYRHISSCSRCRAGMLLLVRGMKLAPDKLPTCTARDHCSTDMAAFIDLENSDPVVAATTYPHVWWRLWTCEECAETYRLATILRDATERGDLPPLPGMRRDQE